MSQQRKKLQVWNLRVLLAGVDCSPRDTSEFFFFFQPNDCKKKKNSEKCSLIPSALHHPPACGNVFFRWILSSITYKHRSGQHSSLRLRLGEPSTQGCCVHLWRCKWVGWGERLRKMFLWWLGSSVRVFSCREWLRTSADRKLALVTAEASSEDL